MIGPSLDNPQHAAVQFNDNFLQPFPCLAITTLLSDQSACALAINFFQRTSGIHVINPLRLINYQCWRAAIPPATTYLPRKASG